MTNEQIAKLVAEARELQLKSTPVNGWYAHTEDMTVRGPFHRWFRVDGDFDDGWKETQSAYSRRVLVADASDDVRFASFAMTNLSNLCTAIEVLTKRLEKCKEQRDRYIGISPMSVHYRKQDTIYFLNKELDEIGSGL